MRLGANHSVFWLYSGDEMMKAATLATQALARVAAIPAVTLLVLSTPVLAGGLAEPLAEPALEAPTRSAPSRQPFVGPYLGASLGYAFNGDDRVGIRGAGAPLDLQTLEESGAFGGLHVGYRTAPLNGWSYGVELGVIGGGVSDEFSTGTAAAKTELNHAVSLRAAAGRVVGDALLVYGFGGIAYGRFDYRVNVPGRMDLDTDFSRTGYILGLGVEKQVSDHWSLRGEYQFSNFGKETLTDVSGSRTEATPKFHSLSLGVSYNF